MNKSSQLGGPTKGGENPKGKQKEAEGGSQGGTEVMTTEGKTEPAKGILRKIGLKAQQKRQWMLRKSCREIPRGGRSGHRTWEY